MGEAHRKAAANLHDSEAQIIRIEKHSAMERARADIRNNHHPIRCASIVAAVSAVHDTTVADVVAVSAMLLSSAVLSGTKAERSSMISGALLMAYEMIAEADADAEAAAEAAAA